MHRLDGIFQLLGEDVILRRNVIFMLKNSIAYRVLTEPFLYEWLLAFVSPLLIWALLKKIARRHPAILPRIYPLLKTLTWSIWVAMVMWGLYCLLGQPGTKVFFKGQLLILNLFNGVNQMRHWVGRRVDPISYSRESAYGWWPTPKEPYVGPKENI
ncbi:MAG TPA: hypothetical protein VGK24_07710 [Candidatus Angelobacter sp.]